MAWIAGEKVMLRAWEREDVRSRWEADQTADSTEIRLRDWHEPPRSLQQREAEFDAQQADPDPATVALIIEAEGRVVGDVNLFHYDAKNRNASIGLSIWRREDRDRGYGTDAMRALMRWGFREFNLHRIELSVAPENERALHVYAKLGFALEGRRRESAYADGRYNDEVIMGVLRAEFEARDHAGTRETAAGRTQSASTA